MSLDIKAIGTLGVVVGGLAIAAVMIGTANENIREQVAAPKAVVSPVPATPAAAATQQDYSHVAQASAPHSKFTHYRVGQRNVKSIFAEEGGVMWVGTSGGVIRYDTANDDYRHYDVRNGLLANGVFHVSRIKEGIAVGTYGGGLSVLNEANGEWTNYNVPEGLGDAFVYDLVEVENGDIWIATWTGVNRVVNGRLDDPSAWEVYTVENTNGGLPNDWVYGLAAGKDGVVWLATEGGLARYDYADASWQHWTHKDGLGAPYDQVKSQNEFTRDPAKYSTHHARQKIEQGLQDVTTAYNPNYIVSLEVDSQGVVWAGTWGGGLSRFDGKEWTIFTETDGLPANHVFMLHEDQNKDLWIGTSSGLSKRSAGSNEFKNFTTRDGLFSNTVFSMATQSDGSLWVGSFGGVARLTGLGG